MGFLTPASTAYPQAAITESNRAAAETQHILNTLESAARGGKRYRPYASAVAFCPRENWFQTNLEKEAGGVLPATLNLYQGVGNGVEERIVSGLMAHGHLLGAQVKLPNPPKNFGIDVGGYIDAIAYDSQGRVAAYEVKTTGAIPTSPKPKHLAQAMAYACLGGIDIVYLVYIGRQVQAFPDPSPLVKVFQVDVGKLLLEYMITVVASCHALTGKNAPPRPATFRKSHECHYCDFVTQCWADVDFTTMPPAEAAAYYAEAEKTAAELIAHRPSFKIQLLENCTPSCPVGSQDKLQAEIKAAREANDKSKRAAHR